MENQKPKIPKIQFLWFVLVIVFGVGYIFSFKSNTGSCWEIVCFVGITFALYKATRVWVKYNPRDTDDPNDVMM